MIFKTARPSAGFTLLEIMLVVSLIGMLTAIVVPGFIRARTRSMEATCNNNLRQIESAKARWALETKQGPAALPSDANLFGAGLYLLKKPVCPAAGQYTLDVISNPPTCDQPGHRLD
jgi:prepilin-type N-terminal cleavage/methylation domain-containing protein